MIRNQSRLRRNVMLFAALQMAHWAATTQAHEGHHAESIPYPAQLQFKPTPLPDRVVLTWSGDPRTSIDVTWRTDDSIHATTAQIARADSLVGNMKDGDVPSAKQVEGAAQDFLSDLGASRVHSIRFNGLEPATMYAYRVGDGGKNWSEWFQFRTAAAAAEPFTFVYFGDAQNEVRSLWSRVVREANQHAPRAAFMLHAGDLINHPDSDAEWGEWFGAPGWLNGMIPVVATPGNHEYDDDGRLSRHWLPQFAFPMNGPSGLEETTYWFDYQGARIISLNSNERVEEQCGWLKSVLADPQRPKWTIATFHHPVFSASKDRDNPNVRAAWRPILEEHGVDLVLQGHDHSYARTGLGSPQDSNVVEGVRAKSSNTVYVVSVSGPKMYYLQGRWQFQREASGVQLFQVIRVAPDKIGYEARLATGELYDAFSLTKNEQGQSTLTEQIPNASELRLMTPGDDDD